jgi:hypothetical protein
LEAPASRAMRPAGRAAGAPSAPRLAAAPAGTGGRGALRPRDRQPLPPRHQVPSLAPRQGAGAMPHGPLRQEARPEALTALWRRAK